MQLPFNCPNQIQADEKKARAEAKRKKREEMGEDEESSQDVEITGFEDPSAEMIKNEQKN